MVRLAWMGVLAVGLALPMVASLHAASYGSFSSSTGTVSFVDVGDLNGLYGAPLVQGHSLDFSPNAFEADCALSGSALLPGLDLATLARLRDRSTTRT